METFSGIWPNLLTVALVIKFSAEPVSVNARMELFHGFVLTTLATAVAKTVLASLYIVLWSTKLMIGSFEFKLEFGIKIVCELGSC